MDGNPGMLKGLMITVVAVIAGLYIAKKLNIV
jgi:hypothetical protein